MIRHLMVAGALLATLLTAACSDSASARPPKGPPGCTGKSCGQTPPPPGCVGKSCGQR